MKMEKSLLNVILDLKEENSTLKDELIDLKQSLKFNRENELLEFVKDLYVSLSADNTSLIKEQIIENLKKYIESFVKDNNIRL